MVFGWVWEPRRSGCFHCEIWSTRTRTCTSVVAKRTRGAATSVSFRHLQAEDILGLYPLPQPSEQPSTVAELSASIIAFLQATSDAAGVAAANATGGYMYRYSYFGDAVPIQSDQSLVVSG